MSKPCQWDGGCCKDALPKERFCPAHRVAMLRRMEADGYLQPLPQDTAPRSNGQCEDVMETKFGREE